MHDLSARCTEFEGLCCITSCLYRLPFASAPMTSWCRRCNSHQKTSSLTPTSSPLPRAWRSTMTMPWLSSTPSPASRSCALMPRCPAASLTCPSGVWRLGVVAVAPVANSQTPQLVAAASALSCLQLSRCKQHSRGHAQRLPVPRL